MTSTEKTSEQLYREWLGHPYFKYRGCAPDADDPLRMAGNPGLHVGAHHGPDAWNPEGQKERRAREQQAIKVCQGCPVRAACDAYASSVTADGKLAQPDGVWGGRLGRDRRRAFEARRHQLVGAAPVAQVRTKQKQAVLLALAMSADAQAVADAAGLDVRTANWQRSRLVTQFGLDKTRATRGELLVAAVEAGLLDAAVIVADDGLVPAVPPPTRVTVQGDAVAPLELAVSAVVEAGERAPDPLPRALRPRRRRVAAVPGQLSFDDALAPAPVSPLFPANRRLEAAA
jgi:hypothetical protein